MGRSCKSSNSQLSPLQDLNISFEKGISKLKVIITACISMHLWQSNPIVHARHQTPLGCSNDPPQGQATKTPGGVGWGTAWLGLYGIASLHNQEVYRLAVVCTASLPAFVPLPYAVVFQKVSRFSLELGVAKKRVSWDKSFCFKTASLAGLALKGGVCGDPKRPVVQG